MATAHSYLLTLRLQPRPIIQKLFVLLIPRSWPLPMGQVFQQQHRPPVVTHAKQRERDAFLLCLLVASALWSGGSGFALSLEAAVTHVVVVKFCQARVKTLRRDLEGISCELSPSLRLKGRPAQRGSNRTFGHSCLFARMLPRFRPHCVILDLSCAPHCHSPSNAYYLACNGPVAPLAAGSCRDTANSMIAVTVPAAVTPPVAMTSPAALTRPASLLLLPCRLCQVIAKCHDDACCFDIASNLTSNAVTLLFAACSRDWRDMASCSNIVCHDVAGCFDIASNLARLP